MVADPNLVTLASGKFNTHTNLAPGGVASFLQATPANQPVYTAVDATLGGHGTFVTDGAATWVSSTYNPPAPGTTATWRAMIVQHVSRIASGMMIGGSATNRFGIQDSAASPNVHGSNGVAGADLAMALSTWFLVFQYLKADVVDYTNIGATKQIQTGVVGGYGNTDPAALLVGVGTGGTSGYGNYKYHLIHECTGGEPTLLERQNYIAWATKWTKGACTVPTTP
jgi:hypothetical protein